jgi:hypothetical protein
MADLTKYIGEDGKLREDLVNIFDNDKSTKILDDVLKNKDNLAKQKEGNIFMHGVMKFGEVNKNKRRYIKGE